MGRDDARDADGRCDRGETQQDRHGDAALRHLRVAHEGHHQPGPDERREDQREPEAPASGHEAFRARAAAPFEEAVPRGNAREPGPAEVYGEHLDVGERGARNHREPRRVAELEDGEGNGDEEPSDGIDGQCDEDVIAGVHGERRRA
jgi:hypothetical protein